ncbi:MAG: nitrilase-related carbon-nitrogen hydrolase [Gemmatimonadota bacterium]|nr:nitrilase-related carbon-nitrogen hydrolase [Gemmatimonadota bacterium]
MTNEHGVGVWQVPPKKQPAHIGDRALPDRGCSSDSGVPGHGRDHRQGLRTDRGGRSARSQSHRVPRSVRPWVSVRVCFIPPGKTHPLRALYSALHRNSMAIPGPESRRLAEAAGDHQVTVAVGVNERNSESSDSTLFNTLLYLGADGRILGKHRKLVPAAGERLVWA